MPQFKETLTGNVITAVSNAIVGLTFYYNSNAPTNCPPNGGYGSYIIFKASSTQVRVIYCDANGLFAMAGINPTTATSVTWKTTTFS